MKVLVVPTNRPDQCRDFLAQWRGRHGADEVWVIEDAPERTFLPDADRHYCWADIAKILGEDSWIISKRDSAIRCFGFLAAHWAGADAVLTLDDDCYPLEGHLPLMERHLASMSGFLRWQTSCNGLRVRGIPYRNLGKLPPTVAHVGLWAGMPDLDGKTQLQWEKEGHGYFYPPAGTALLAHGQYAPLCGMNLCIRREALPLFYYPLMGQDQPYRRFDDIWAGIIAKKLCDHLGWHVSLGEPFIEHRRASDAQVNLAKEAPGMEANETLWEVVDGIPLSGPGPGHYAVRVVRHLGRCLEQAGTDDYIRALGKALQVWASLFANRPDGL